MVRFLHVLVIGSALLGLSASATAQDKEKPAEAADSANTEKTPAQAEDKPKNKQVDLDKFFKQGEDNAKTSSCNKPAKPADPMA